MKIIRPLIGLASITMAFSCCDRFSRHHSKTTISYDKALPAMLEKELPAAPPPFFVAGAYTTFEMTGFCSLWDTIVISKKKNEINVYRVERRARIKTNLNGKTLGVHYHHDDWYGSYDPVAKTMHIISTGNNLAIKPETATLELDEMEYQKIE